MSIIDIIMICIGATAVMIYATLKTIQVVKFKKLTKHYYNEIEGITYEEAKQKAYEYVFKKRPKNEKDVEETYEG